MAFKISSRVSHKDVGVEIASDKEKPQQTGVSMTGFGATNTNQYGWYWSHIFYKKEVIQSNTHIADE